MLDFRIETFLTLCEEKSYTKTAGKLCITQPAVSQHIRYLEQYYGCKLFYYKGKNLILTKQGEQLLKYALISKADWNKVTDTLKTETGGGHISFGATLTIGEYVMPEILSKLIEQSYNNTISMLVDNTETLLQKLQQGLIEFAFVEGQLDKKEYTTRLFSPARFIPVCSLNHEFARRCVSFDEIFSQRLIVREVGSGTRGVLEQVLLEHNQNIQSFSQIVEIGNLNVIKNLVGKGLGITFLYENAVENEIARGLLNRIRLSDFEAEREFNFVCMKGSQFTEKNLEFFERCQNIYHSNASDPSSFPVLG
ncbi:LysR family transcriptional regulator [Anaerocolumna sedimenticola]|uniref:LysR family transcriptional regulator n=1 Tax=Anaerocolumna sedimenticola TaxID=2696063 RepID=A0A6P1TP78_9FIRM|nr:LysR family transcriptional regulator [Anaerocolumna sedimenticola]QHQ63070.1 LysR family transcriptional regulator [Anaerocolumna sedimenticola]